MKPEPPPALRTVAEQIVHGILQYYECPEEVLVMVEQALRAAVEQGKAEALQERANDQQPTRQMVDMAIDAGDPQSGAL